jgi:hypothetical protein
MAQQSVELYGRGRVLRFVTDALERSGERDTPPLVLMTGPRGSGKTVLIDRIETDNKAGWPTARLDFALKPDATPAQIMLAIGTELHRHTPLVGKIQIPLLGMGISALTLDSNKSSSPEEQLDGRLRTGRIGTSFASVAADAAKLLPSPEQQAMLTEAGALLGWIVDGFKGRQLGARMAWYKRNFDPGDGTRYGPLLELYARWCIAVNDREKAEVRGNARRDVWRALCEAFLADLRSEFDRATLRHDKRTANCLLLLDNTDATIGVEFLETLAECRRLAMDQTDPLLIVAAQRIRPKLRPPVGPPIGAAEEKLSYAVLRTATRDPEAPAAPWYPVRLTELSVENLEKIVTSHLLSSSWHDQQFVHEVTGGHSAAVERLAGVLRRARPGSDLRDLVTPVVEDSLLEDLRPARLDDRSLGAMAVFGATLHPQPNPAAKVFAVLGWADVNELDVRDRFLDLMWASDEGGFTIRPLPRLLLTRWLARDASMWDDVHEAFLAHYRPRETSDPDPVCYHQLALITSLPGNGLDAIAAHLDRRLPDAATGVSRDWDKVSSARRWEESLSGITTAPNRLRQSVSELAAKIGTPDLHPEARDVVMQLAGISVAGDRRRIVARLLAGLWLYNDRLFDPKHTLAGLIAREYLQLAQVTPGDNEVFYGRASHFRQIAREWEDRL